MSVPYKPLQNRWSLICNPSKRGPNSSKISAAVYNPDLIKDFYDTGCHVVCPNCNRSIPVHYQVLINCPRGMFLLNTARNLYDLRYALYDWGVVDFDGAVVNLEPSDGSRNNKGS
ncbi:MAG: hypothetical protein ACW987_20510 [Candidatus Thorarchaeota archaeon]|jgi:hypothetical protein